MRRIDRIVVLVVPFVLGASFSGWADTTTLGIAPASAVPGSTPSTLSFALTRSGDLDFDAVCAFHTVDGSALAGLHYTATSGTVFVPAGATSATIPVTIAPDAGDGVTRNFQLLLDGATGVGAATAFGGGQAFTVGGLPRAAVATDVNGDGRPDLVVANSSDGTVSVLLNTNFASTIPAFAAQQTFVVGNTPFGVAVGDINGDGRPDLVSANTGSGSVSVLLNTTAPGNATLTFSAQPEIGVGTNPTDPSLADLNGDGRPDLIVIDANGSVAVRLNQTALGATSASFAALQQFAIGAMAFSLAAVDLNGDGRPDLAVANYDDDNVSVLFNLTAPGATSASFDTQQTFAAGDGPARLVAVDVNGDGRPDLVTANEGSENVSVLINTTPAGATTPSFAPPRAVSVGAVATAVAAGDLNGDGKAELIVGTSAGFAAVLRNRTAPGALIPDFAARQNVSFAGTTSALVLSDVNADGIPDLVGTSLNTASVVVSANAGNLTPPRARLATQQPFTTGSGAHAVTTTDVNGDGRPDLAVANAGANTVSVLLDATAPGARTASFATQQPFATAGSPYAVVSADVNGDGRPDLITANNNVGSVSVFLNTTSAGATTPSFAGQQPFAVGAHPDGLAATDLNGDGRADLVTANTFPANTVSVLLNTTALGATTPDFSAQQTFATGAFPQSVATADVNGDGRADLIVGAYDAASISVLLNTTGLGAATPSFDPFVPFPTVTGAHPFAVTSADVNNDGRPDVIATNYSPDSLSVLVNATDPGAIAPTFGAQQSFATGGYPFSVTADDIDGDGRADIIVGNYFDSSASLLVNTTAPFTSTPTFAAQTTFPVGSIPYSVATADFNGDGKPDLVAANAAGSTASVLLNTQYLVGRTGSPATGTLLADVLFKDSFE